MTQKTTGERLERIETVLESVDEKLTTLAGQNINERLTRHETYWKVTVSLFVGVPTLIGAIGYML